MEDLTGVFVPLITPFTDAGEAVSEVRLTRLVRRHLEEGAGGFVVGTDSGEFTALSFAERKSVLEIVLREAGGKPVFVNVSATGSGGAVDLAQHASRHGARGVVAMPPYYGRLSTEEIVGFFHALAQYGGLPVAVVDPSGVLNEGTRTQIAAIQGASVASEASGLPFATDAFAYGGMEATPAAILVSPVDLMSGAAMPALGDLRKLLAAFGGARVGKAGFALRDVEVGTPRGPLLPLRGEPLEELRGVLAGLG